MATKGYRVLYTTATPCSKKWVLCVRTKAGAQRIEEKEKEGVVQ